MKKIENVLKEFVRKLSDEDLRYLSVRSTQSLSGDKAELAEFLAKERSIDNWLSSASSCVEWFDMVDMVGDFVKKENSRRYGDDNKSSKSDRKSKERQSA